MYLFFIYFREYAILGNINRAGITIQSWIIKERGNLGIGPVYYHIKTPALISVLFRK